MRKATKKNKKKIVISLIIAAALLLLIIFRMSGLYKFTPAFFQFLFNRNIELKKTANQRINILLLGIGGGNHDGPNLTDTIIFASVDSVANKVTLVSVPRDLWVPDLKGKVNTAYAFGEEKEKGGGITLARAALSKVLDQPINYVLRIDFDGFVKAIDLIGGLDIDVANVFFDYKYPIEENATDLCGHTLEEATAQIATESPYIVFPCRYQHVHFDKGIEHMDGKRALIFVRSRYADGIEGTDFARSKRQGKVIASFKEKVFSLGTLLNPAKVLGLYNVLQSSIDTDIKPDELDDFIKLAQKMKNVPIQSFVIDSGDETTKQAGLLVNPPIDETYGMQWVLIPRIGDGDFSEIQSYIACVLAYKQCIIKQKNETKPSP